MTAATGIPVKSKTTSRNGAGGVNHTSGGGVGTTVASRIVKGQTAALSPTVTDHVPVGSVEILTSAHVSSGPGQIAHAPVPSVFRDDRGTIDRLRVGGKRINLLYSKTGVMRSGYLHPEAKYDFVVCGEVEVWLLTTHGTDKTVYKAMESFVVPAYTPHIFHYLSDTVVVEWWDQAGDTECWFYHPYRRIVDVQNSILSTSMGQHHFLVPQIESDRQQNEAPGIGTGMLILASGLTIGLLVGGYLGRSSMK